MKILAIESSCDETAAAVVEDGRHVLSNIVATQIEEHRLYGGVVPEIASRRHCEAIVGVTEEALARAGVSLSEIDAVAVTYAPGLIGALLVGVNFAKGLALSTGKPLIRGELSGISGFGAALPLPCDFRRAQPYCRGQKLYGFPCCRTHPGRCGWRGLRQSGARDGIPLSRRN